VVGWPGFEPGTNNLKGCCSTLSFHPKPWNCRKWVSPVALGKTFRPKLYCPAIDPTRISTIPFGHRQKIGNNRKIRPSERGKTYVLKSCESGVGSCLGNRFKNGDQAAFNDRVPLLGSNLLDGSSTAAQPTGRRGGHAGCLYSCAPGLGQISGRFGFFHLAIPDRDQLGAESLLVLVAAQARQIRIFDAPVSAKNDMTLADIIPAEVQTPDDITVTAEFVSRIGKGMEKLSSKHREILTLRNVKNLSYEEIAEILNISVGTVKSRNARARDSLKAKLRKTSNERRGIHRTAKPLPRSRNQPGGCGPAGD